MICQNEIHENFMAHSSNIAHAEKEEDGKFFHHGKKKTQKFFSSFSKTESRA